MSAINIQSSRTERLDQMPEKVLENLMGLLYIQSSSHNEKRMVVYLIDRLRELGLDFYIDATGNILVSKGKTAIYPCIVCHIDTVHDIHDDFNITIENKNERQIAWATTMNEETGIGGDDKCGIFACLKMLRHFKNMKAVFFTQEETGLVGSSRIDHKWFKDVGYIIQLDRWGRSDLICIKGNHKTVSKEFLTNVSPAAKKYGFSPEVGLITDSINLWNNNIGVSCINVSCGYYQHHTSQESIDLNELWNAILFTKDMIEALGEHKYPSKPSYKKPKQCWGNRWNNWGYDGGYTKQFNLPAKKSGNLPFGDDLFGDDDIDDSDIGDTINNGDILTKYETDVIEFIETEIDHRLYPFNNDFMSLAYERFCDFLIIDVKQPVSFTNFMGKVYKYYK
jgi:hypothetical protein